MWFTSSLGGGWRWGARPSSVWVRVRAHPPGPWMWGTLGSGGSRLGTTAQPGQGGSGPGCSPGLVLVGALVLAGVGEPERAGRAQPEDDVGLGVLPLSGRRGPPPARWRLGCRTTGTAAAPTWLRSSAVTASGPVAGGDGLDLGHIGPGVVVGVQGPIQPAGSTGGAQVAGGGRDGVAGVIDAGRPSRSKSAP